MPAVPWILLLLLALAACSRSDPETALRGSVASLQAALEQRDAAAMQQHLAEDFIGNGGLDRDGARRLAAMYLLRHRDIGITTGPLEVEMAAEHATVRFTAMLRGGSGRALPDAAQVYDVETGWRLDDGDWKLASARWAPAL
ncbi:nuclear transport factor 2 family protein [Luteimonas marina]|uniref:Nuclear transport factor 2 family protein n=1 Tax=Luteimonas marina TaxID=488485 RepID=A0A5C5UC28_9GAMM|nr:nuclear transport factor 2 family protein [Luteimonas marina]